MRIAIAQMETRAGDLPGTARRMAELSERAAGQGVDLLVFPAQTLCGTSPVAYPDREGFFIDLAESLVGLIDELACPCLVPVLTDLDGTPIQEAMLVANGDLLPVRLSTYLTAMAQADGELEERPLPELEFAGARLGVAFTYDDLDDYDDYEYDVDVIVYLPGYGFATDDSSSALGSALTEGRFLADAEATGAWIVAAGGVGLCDSQVFPGSSFVLAPWGELAAQGPSFEEALVVCDVDPSAEGPLAHPLAPEVYDAPLTTWGALVSGLAGTCAAMGRADACCLLDGGLASSLVAALATDALGPTHVRALVLRGAGADVTSAERLVRSLRLPEDAVSVIDLSSEGDPLLARDLAEAHLAALARRTGALALGSADKTGLALGDSPRVSTAGLLPLGDLYRSDVVALAHLRNTISPVLPAAAFAGLRAPEVDGLSEAFSSVEARVQFVDLVLSAHVEWELPVSDIVAERGHDELVLAVVNGFRAAASAGLPGCPVITCSSKTLAEARGPRWFAWRDRVRSEDERAGRGILRSIERSVRGAVAPEPQDRDEGAEDAAGAPAAQGGEERERDMSDLLGYLRDFLPGGGFSPLPPQPGEQGGGRRSAGEDHGRPLWEGPFSEN